MPLHYEYGIDQEATVVLWSGQYWNDGKGFLELWLSLPGYATRWLHKPRLVGEAGSWQVIAEAYVAKGVVE